MNLGNHDKQNFIKLLKYTLDVVPIAKLFFIWCIFETWQVNDCE